jgi:hypothetical protein
MRTSRSRIYVVALALLLAGWTGTARAVVLDWNSVLWADGSKKNSYDLTGDGVTDITVELTAQNNNVWTTDPTGAMTPAVDEALTGGMPAGDKSLVLAADLHTNSNVTLHLSFTGGPGGLLGANNVSFTLFDIDITTNRDIIDNIYALAPDGSKVPATITNLGSAVTLSGSGLTYELDGNAASPNNSSNGNATISFGSTLIYDVFLTFSNTAGAPRYQDIAIGDITFTPVPEINPAISASVSCLLAIGLTVFVQRRARLRRNTR